MATYPYTGNPARVKAFLKQIQDIGVPPKMTQKYLESLGYRSKNDRALLTIARSLGFVDSSGSPTETWRQFRNKNNAPGVMAGALRSTYSELFTTYPDACRRDNEALRNFFSTHTNVGEGALRFMVATFKALCELADFEADTPDGIPAGLEAVALSPSRRATAASHQAGITMNINVQLQIPDTSNPDTYENFFAAMKKHILS